MNKDTKLRDEIEKIQLDLVEKTANPTTKWEDVIPEATSQILSLLEGMVKTNNITWTKLGDRTFISRDELLEKLK